MGGTPPKANDAWVSFDAVAAKAKAKSKRALEPASGRSGVAEHGINNNGSTSLLFVDWARIP